MSSTSQTWASVTKKAIHLPDPVPLPYNWQPKPEHRCWFWNLTPSDHLSIWWGDPAREKDIRAFYGSDPNAMNRIKF